MSLAQNKFLIGLGAVVLVGAGALGYLTYDAAGKFSAVQTEFNEKSAAYMNLERLDLYPNAANLKKLEESGVVVDAAVEALQTRLKELNIPLEAISPEQFQDRLRATVSAVVEKANAAGVQLPDNFYLGFNRYQSSPPKTDLAAPLWRQLKAVEIAVNTLIDSRIAAVTELNRIALPGEDSSASVAAAPAPAKKAVPAKGSAAKKTAAAAPAVRLVSKFPFEIQFIADQPNLRRALNGLASNKTQFFIVQPLLIENEKGRPLSKTDSKATPVSTPMGTPGEAAADGQEGVPRTRDEYIVGTEKLNVVLRLQMVIFGADQTKS